jgi:hypothetical protein
MIPELSYSAIEAASTGEAGDWMSGPIPIDIPVMDHLIPGMTGTALAH